MIKSTTAFIIVSLVLTAIKAHSTHTLYYAHLGLSFDATDAEIKSAYQKLTKKYHPDKYGSSDMFIKVKKAYEVLSDRTKKHIYDTDGPEQVAEYERAERSGYVNQRYNKLRPKNVTVYVSLEELYAGAEKNMTIRRQHVCRKCKGTGAKDGKLNICPHCKGKGVKYERVRTGFGIMNMQTRCDRCGGRGKSASHVCPSCSGRKLGTESKVFKIGIDPGMQAGEVITFAGEGDAVIEALPGDVNFSIKQKGHPSFTRKGDDLHTSVTITFREAIYGFKRHIKQLDGRDIEVKKDGVSQPDSVLRVEGEGMPIKSASKSFGDMYVTVKFKLPFSLTDKQKETVKVIFE